MKERDKDGKKDEESIDDRKPSPLDDDKCNKSDMDAKKDDKESTCNKNQSPLEDMCKQEIPL